MSLRPTDLLRQLREGIVSDESIAAIRKNPLSPQALAAYAQGAIMLSRGAGGKGAGELPRAAVPEKIWNSWEMVKDPVFDPKTGELLKGDVRRDEAGNHYEFLGSHRYVAGGTSEPGGGDLHAIVKPVEAPGEVMGPQHNLPVKEPEWPSIAEQNAYWENKPPTWDEWTNIPPELKEPGPPPIKPLQKFDPGQLPPKTDWGNANDRKYSGPLAGQQWADIYATPDAEFTVGPKKTEAELQQQDWDATLNDFPLAGDKLPPPPKDLDTEFLKMMDRWFYKPPPGEELPPPPLPPRF